MKDRTCAFLDVCSMQQYEQVRPVVMNGMYITARTCAPLKVCGALEEEKTAPVKKR